MRGPREPPSQQSPPPEGGSGPWPPVSDAACVAIFMKRDVRGLTVSLPSRDPEKGGERESEGDMK